MLTLNSIRPLHDHQISNSSTHLCFQYISERTNQYTAFSYKIDKNEINCILNQDCHPMTIISKGDTLIICHQLNDLIKELPQLQDEANLLKLAKIANFLSKGTQYEVIENPKVYIDDYNEIIENENSTRGLSPYALSRYGTFDVSKIQPPRVENNQLIFYVSSKIPYIVTLNYPINSHQQITYELLPYL